MKIVLRIFLVIGAAALAAAAGVAIFWAYGVDFTVADRGAKLGLAVTWTLVLAFLAGAFAGLFTSPKGGGS